MNPSSRCSQELVGDQPAEVARAGDEHALEADAGTPAPLERFAHELTRRVREDDVDDEEEQPDRPRNLVDALASLRRQQRRVVDLEVQRADEPEHDGEDAADEDGKEVVDARAPAAQAIEALHVKGERHEHAEKRQHVEVLRERRLALRDRDEICDPGFETQQVGDDERRHRRGARR